jgi:hypothetical protein
MQRSIGSASRFVLPALLVAAVSRGALADEFFAATNPLPSELFKLEWTTGAIVSIGMIPNIEPTDLAMSPQGVLYASTVDQLFVIDPFTAGATFVGNVSTFSSIVGLEFSATGTMYACTYTGEVMTVDPGTAISAPLLALPVNFAGDLAWRDATTMYGLIEAGSGTGLMKIDLTPGGNHAVLGIIAPGIGFWSLDFDGQGNLIAIALDGDVYHIQNYATSADGTLVASTGQPALGGMTTAAGGCPAPQSYCTPGTTSSGCVATLSGTGTPKASAPSGFVIALANAEPLKQGILFYGVDNSGFAPTPWGTGSSFLCVKSPAQRMGVQNTGGSAGTCSGTLSIDWNTFVSSNPGALGAPFSPGQVVFAQAWFRDPPSPKTTSLSDGLRFVVCP